MATTKEVNAAFDKIYARLHALIDAKVPFMFRSSVLAHLDSVEGRNELVAGIKEGLEAAEKARG